MAQKAARTNGIALEGAGSCKKKYGAQCPKQAS